MKEDVWKLVKEDFDEKIPRRTAILIKEGDCSPSFAYPAEFSSIGYLFDYRKNTTYDESPAFSIKFGEYSFPDLTGKNLSKNTFYCEKMEYFPSLIKRKVIFSNTGIEAEEKFGQVIDNSFFWEINLTCKNHPPYIFDRKFYTIISVNAGESKAKVYPDKNLLEIKMENKKIFIASNFDDCAAYKTIDGYFKDLGKGKIRKDGKEGNHILLGYRVKLRPGESKKLKFGISTYSKEKALKSFRVKNYENKIRNKWNNWFNSLPHPKFSSELDRKAYYKCWWVIKLNYYYDKRYGKTVIEALPVYRGYWQWALPAVQWHTSLNPEVGSSFMKKLLDLFLKYQRKDGYVTHAIYLDEKIPGERWARGNIIQTPHIPWVCLRYYYNTKDIESLKRWYPKLVNYYNYLNKSRDENFLRLHLWAIITSYDTGIDTTSAFQRVTYGENGKKEKFCYPAIFAAERCRYEQAMGKISGILRNKEEGFWFKEAEVTKRQVDNILWDKKKKWYGVLHENKELDTRIGVDGLFPFAYEITERKKAGLTRNNFVKLIGKYGIYTVAPGEKGFYKGTYWRGPSWSTSCALAMVSAHNYYPDLLKRVKNALMNFIFKYPSIWECMGAGTGEIARGDSGMMATPVVASNVGAGEALGAILVYYGENVFSIKEGEA
ncbi:hypothetical protein AUJ66_01135 [Candidatus Desantisbacteria bacterium CG1_02_38_46]|uniref:Mannosylglycerate hydrolase MGH1-like glycoside hydrolase domain-containing protein n=3 Tax=unclassified Candidatus Desantisiibacteriota TaxID=3106372 RepID=A0A2H9PBG7_9BACT|nr:MAG: hypothetical protein AUJ66_01135 [Candidatus Desantisbacteria bacterium CG1_02_38_46]PIU51532.1 MAG: hypothetical protein COS91_03915 [Candidatus Desantisbacteria bacterium CG07_land_8_20_14_0_80_39_15]PIZ16074.1 MAG: hypothetical protein COY51_03575 [Candidatus Desantisbacteria bacterium CG_4_10_14_0_8_um_filter_39_17]